MTMNATKRNTCIRHSPEQHGQMGLPQTCKPRHRTRTKNQIGKRNGNTDLQTPDDVTCTILVQSHVDIAIIFFHLLSKRIAEALNKFYSHGTLCRYFCLEIFRFPPFSLFVSIIYCSCSRILLLFLVCAGSRRMPCCALTYVSFRFISFIYESHLIHQFWQRRRRG